MRVAQARLRMPQSDGEAVEVKVVGQESMTIVVTKDELVKAISGRTFEATILDEHTNPSAHSGAVSKSAIGAELAKAARRMDSMAARHSGETQVRITGKAEGIRVAHAIVDEIQEFE